MIKLKIIAVLFSVVIATIEDLNVFLSDSDAPIIIEEQIAELSSPEPEQPEIVTPTIITNYKVSASVYFPEPNQTDSTPFITADGSRINKNNPKKHRWIAVSRDLHSRWGGDLNFGDSLLVTGVSNELDGIYIVRDIMNQRMHKQIDILVGRQDNIMGLWHSVQLAKLD